MKSKTVSRLMAVICTAVVLCPAVYADAQAFRMTAEETEPESFTLAVYPPENSETTSAAFTICFDEDKLDCISDSAAFLNREDAVTVSTLKPGTPGTMAVVFSSSQVLPIQEPFFTVTLKWKEDAEENTFVELKNAAAVFKGATAQSVLTDTELLTLEFKEEATPSSTPVPTDTPADTPTPTPEPTKAPGNTHGSDPEPNDLPVNTPAAEPTPWRDPENKGGNNEETSASPQQPADSDAQAMTASPSNADVYYEDTSLYAPPTQSVPSIADDVPVPTATPIPAEKPMSAKETAAEAPNSQSSPKSKLSLPFAVLCGSVLAILVLMGIWIRKKSKK